MEMATAKPKKKALGSRRVLTTERASCGLGTDVSCVLVDLGLFGLRFAFVFEFVVIELCSVTCIVSPHPKLKCASSSALLPRYVTHATYRTHDDTSHAPRPTHGQRMAWRGPHGDARPQR